MCVFSTAPFLPPFRPSPRPLPPLAPLARPLAKMQRRGGDGARVQQAAGERRGQGHQRVSAHRTARPVNAALRHRRRHVQARGRALRLISWLGGSRRPAARRGDLGVGEQVRALVSAHGRRGSARAAAPARHRRRATLQPARRAQRLGARSCGLRELGDGGSRLCSHTPKVAPLPGRGLPPRHAKRATMAG